MTLLAAFRLPRTRRCSFSTPPRRARGFTLIELISVLVILGVVSAIGSNFIITAIDSYRISEKRAKIIGKGRVAIEQMTRQLRLALPNSVRVSVTGNCVEFLPVVGGANYFGYVADTQNGAPAVSAIGTSPFTLGLGNPLHVVVGALVPTDIYKTASPAARVGIGALGSAPYTSVPLASNHLFLRNSPRKRLFVTDNPKRFCVAGSRLVEYSSYGLLTTAMDDSNPSANVSLIATSVSASGTAFQLSPGSEDRNTALHISLLFSDRGEQVVLNNTVLIRNVP